jgi:hypothetical protein
VVAKVWRTLAVCKQAAQKFDVGRFNLRKQREVEFRKQYKISQTDLQLWGTSMIARA